MHETSKMHSKPLLLTTTAEVKEWRRSLESTANQLGAECPKIGFVPTMGALHRGHAALLRKARAQCQISVLSIFVNPTQFSPHEDLDCYPRSLENDLQIAAAEGVDLVFAPTPEQLYPAGYSTFIEETHLSLPFCGPFRPGHFRGVTTIVLKLFNLIRPHLALFGLKDAQQFFVLKQMVQDLNLDVKIAGMETVREPDGLALSSRNIYLSPEDRERAPLLYKVLQQVKATLKLPLLGLQTYPQAVTQTLDAARNTLTQNGFNVQYLDCLRLRHFDCIAANTNALESQIIAVAAFLGKTRLTRLIDNILTRDLGPNTSQ